MQHAPLASQSNIQHAPDLQNNHAQSYHTELKKAQEDTTKKIKEKAPGAKIKEVYNTLFSGFSISSSWRSNYRSCFFTRSKSSLPELNI